jgi:hypothetical protein
MRKILSLVAVLAMIGAVIVPGFAAAAVYKGGDTLIVNQEIADDLYIGGGNVTLTQPVTGDVWAGAGMFNISPGANIGQDLNIAGGQVWINADVADDVHIAGGNVYLNANVGDDLMVFSGTAIINGNVKGDVVIFSGTANLAGTVEGNVYFRGGQLALEDNTEIFGNLNYSADEEIVLPANVVVRGETKYTPPDKTSPGANNKIGMFSGLVGFLGIALPFIFLVSLIALFLLTLVVVFAAPLKSQDVTNFMQHHPWKSLGWGLVYMIVVPVVAFILLLLMVTFPISLLTFLVYSLGWILSAPLLAFALGSWILKLLNKNTDLGRRGHLVLAALIGAIVYSLLMLIPFVGGLIIIIGLIISLGALFQVVRPLVFKKRNWPKNNTVSNNPEM